MKNNVRTLKQAALLCLLIFASAQVNGQTATKPEGNGTQTNPYKIETLENLQWLSEVDSARYRHFIQTKNIDASPTKKWDGGKGFETIGTFLGTYNGKGHTIDSLYINRPAGDGLGLFRKIDDDTARVDSLGLTNIDFTGKRLVGGLTYSIGFGTVSNCYTTGKINVKEDGGGGIAKNNAFANLRNSYSRVSVTIGSYGAGGLITDNYGSTKTSYSTGEVKGDSLIGGLIGRKDPGYTADSCFWDIETSGIDSSVGGTGLTTEEMTNDTTYLNNGWDFVCEDANGTEDTWARVDNMNDGYPFLAWQWEGPVPVKNKLPDITGEDSVVVSTSPKAFNICGDSITGSTEDLLKYTEVGTYTITWTYEDAEGNTTTQKQTVVVEEGEETAISNLEEANISIYPNPAKNLLNINPKDNKIQLLTISDMTGKTRVEKTNIENHRTINLSQLNSGIYIIRIETKEGRFSSKLVKK